MIVIGSTAIASHFPDFPREPKDLDLVAERDELRAFSSITPFGRCKEYVWGRWGSPPAKAQVEIVGVRESSYVLPSSGVRYGYINDAALYLPSPEWILATKAAVLLRPLKFETWEKHMGDYHFLKRKGVVLTPMAQDFVTLRRAEYAAETKARQPDLKMSNEDFFGGSEQFIHRVYPHDTLHEVTCFGARPVFEQLKKDLSQAALDHDLWRELPHAQKVQLIQEEGFAIALERLLIPRRYQMCAHEAFRKAIYRILTRLMGGPFRDFGIEHWPEVLELHGYDYCRRFVQWTQRARHCV